MQVCFSDFSFLMIDNIDVYSSFHICNKFYAVSLTSELGNRKEET